MGLGLVVESGGSGAEVGDADVMVAEETGKESENGGGRVRGVVSVPDSRIGIEAVDGNEGQRRSREEEKQRKAGSDGFG